MRQLLGSANIDGGPLFHLLAGNLSFQVEHHLYPDMPSSRYAEIAPRVRDICRRYELPYNTGPLSKQLGTVHRTILRLPSREARCARSRDRIGPSAFRLLCLYEQWFCVHRGVIPRVGGLRSGGRPVAAGGRPQRQRPSLRQDSTYEPGHRTGPIEQSPNPEAEVLEQDPVPNAQGPTPEEIQEPVLENLDRFITGVITVVPPALVVLAGWQLWNRGLHLRDIVLFIVLYIPIGLGVTVGFHRLLTHRSFKTSPALRGLLAVLGTMSIEGPVISWVADHRKHHAYSDRLGDPHSPHVDHGGGWKGALRGLGHAHVGWLFDHQQRGARERFAPDLIADPVVNFVDKTFIFWSLLGLAIPFGLGWLIAGTVAAGLEAMLWAGAVRIFILHHVTYSINSLCHFFGRRRFATDDESHNLSWLAPFSLRRGVAQQPPRVPHVGLSRHGQERGRPVGPDDLGPRAPWPRVGRAADQSGPPGRQDPHELSLRTIRKLQDSSQAFTGTRAEEFSDRSFVFNRRPEVRPLPGEPATRATRSTCVSPA